MHFVMTWQQDHTGMLLNIVNLTLFVRVALSMGSEPNPIVNVS